MQKNNIFSIFLVALILQSCSYASPSPADNIVGKTHRQRTNSNDSRRAPNNNIDPSDVSSDSNVAKADAEYDAYQHYQSANPPKKTRRSPILNIRELNEVMDQEAPPAPIHVDANSNLKQIIDHNKAQKAKKVKKEKKKAKILVITKEIKNVTPAEVKPAALAKATPEPIIAKKITPVVKPNKPKAPQVSLPQTVTTKAAPIVKTNQPVPQTITPVEYVVPAAPVAAPAPVKVANTPAVESSVKTPNSEAPNIAPIALPKAIEVAPAPIAAPAPINSPTIDLNNMSQQDIEKALKSKFSNNKATLNNEAIKTQPAQTQPAQTPPAQPAPMPALPSTSNITESLGNSKISNLNDLFIEYYFRVKHFLLGIFSF